MTLWQKRQIEKYPSEPGEALMLVGGVQAAGITYELHPCSRQRIQEAHPGINLIPKIMIGWEAPGDVLEMDGDKWGTIAAVLTGITQGEWMGLLVVYFPQLNVEYWRE